MKTTHKQSGMKLLMQMKLHFLHLCVTLISLVWAGENWVLLGKLIIIKQLPYICLFEIPIIFLLRSNFLWFELLFHHSNVYY